MVQKDKYIKLGFSQLNWEMLNYQGKLEGDKAGMKNVCVCVCVLVHYLKANAFSMPQWPL